MQKAQTGLIIPAILGLVVLVLGVQIVNDTVTPYCTGIDYGCYANHNFTNITYFNLPYAHLVPGTVQTYNRTTCGATKSWHTMTEGTNYVMNNTDGGILLVYNGAATSSYNKYNQSIRYVYRGPDYQGDLVCTGVNNWPILFAIGGMMLAIGWIATRP